MAPNKNLTRETALLDYLWSIWLLKSSFNERPFALFIPRIKPSTSPAFIKTAFIWKGEKWNIKVVGIINISRRYAPNLCLKPEMKSVEPKIKQIMASSNKKGAKVWGIFLLEITSTVCSKFIILPGIA